MSNIPDFSALPPAQQKAAADAATKLQPAMFKFMAATAMGKAPWKTRPFALVPDIVAFLQEHSPNVQPLAVLPDFQTYQYHLIYQEIE